MKHFLTFLVCLYALAGAGQSYKLHDKVQVKWGAQWYNADILDAKDGKFKIHYEGYGNNWDEWVTTDRIKNMTAQAMGASPAGGAYKIGDKVEAWNVKWYAATILEIGSGNMADYVKVHYDDFSAASDQWLKASNVRRKTNNSNTAKAPRSGRYIILSYGNPAAPITIGYFDLSNGGYTYLNAAKKMIGKGACRFVAATQKIEWLDGPFKAAGWMGDFTVTREGKTHQIRLNRVTTGTNSTDSQ